MFVFDDIDGVRTQCTIWGYFLTGDLIETAAVIAEGHSELVYGAWDRGAIEIACDLVAYGDEPYRPAKDWTALPWVGEHLIRGHEPWEGM